MEAARAGFVSFASQRMKRYDGLQKCSRTWHGVRKDEELWFEHGDCLVHLYAPGTSRRDPSLRIPIRLLEESGDTYLLSQCIRTHEMAGAKASSDTRDTTDGDSGDAHRHQSFELFIAAPTELARAEAFLYHVGTRNYFAYLASKPIVGESLGRALADLAHRVEAWHPASVGTTAFLGYCEEQGYLDFANNPDYALAGLHFAERARIRSVWVDAFAHCVGMHDQLDHSREARRISLASKALVSRASLEVQRRVSRASKAVGNFLADELGPEFHGLSPASRAHLDRYRRSLHAFYATTLGSFPPPGRGWQPQLWRSMQEDFRCLYDYLADPQATNDPASSRGVGGGGLCTTQNISAFNQRHAFAPLPHPVPLIPEHAEHGHRPSTVAPHKAFRNFVRGRSALPSQPALSSHVKQALADASNAGNPAVVSNRLVQEYIRFESLRLEEKVSLAEARKVRWLLIYAVLQLLSSMTRAPAEVQDSETALYPMCVATSACIPWEQPTSRPAEDGYSPEAERVSAEMAAARDAFQADRISIHPDCEAGSAEEYFAMTGLGRSDSDKSLTPLQQRSSPQPTRTASIRSSVTSLHRSMVGSLKGRRNSVSGDGGVRSRRDSLRHDSLLHAPRKMASASFCEDLVEEDDEPDETRSAEGGFQGCVEFAEVEAPISRVDTLLPILETHQMGVYNNDTGPSPASSTHSGVSSQFSDLSASTCHRRCESPATELSSPATDKSDFGPDTWPFQSAPGLQQGGRHAQSRLETTPKGLTALPPLTRRAKCPTGYDRVGGFSVNTSCDDPTSSAAPPGKKSSQARNRSSGSLQSLASSASSEYPEHNTQAAEIEEKEVRGRPRVRIRAFCIVDGRISLPHSPAGEAR